MTTLFSMRGRVNRKRYVTVAVLANMAIYIVAAATSGHHGAAAPVLMALFFIAGQVVVSCHVVRRLHDLGRPGSHFWLLLVPFYNMYLSVLLLFKKGTLETNEYGPDPLGRVPALAASV